MSEINKIASRFLESYLQQNPAAEVSPAICCHRTQNHDYNHDAATEFVRQIEDDRIFVSEPETVVILRTCPRRLPAFLAGIRRGKLVFTYHQHLAQVFQRDEATAVSKMLEEQGIPNYSLPSLERSSF